MAVTVEIPVPLLLRLATDGKMEHGEISDFLQLWAQRECERLNLQDRLKKMQLAKLDRLRRAIGYDWGEKALECIDSAIEAVK